MQDHRLIEFLKGQIVKFLNLNNIDISTGYFKCLNPNHNDSKNSMSYDAKQQVVHCYGCGCSYNIFDLIGIFYGIYDFEKQVAYAQKILLDNKENNKLSTTLYADKDYTIQVRSINVEDVQVEHESYVEQCFNQIYDTDLFEKYHISLDLVNKLKIGFEPCFNFDKKEAQAVIFPISAQNFIALDFNEGNYFNRSNDIFGKINNADKSLFIAKDEFEALLLINLGFSAIAIHELSQVDNILNVVDNYLVNNIYILIDSEDYNLNLCESIFNVTNEDNLKSTIIDLSFPYNSLKEFALRDIHKLKDRIEHISTLLLSKTKQLKLNTEKLYGVDKEGFLNFDLEKTIFYGIVCDANIRRKFIAHWLLSTERRFLLCSSYGDWDIFGSLMNDKIMKYGMSYKQRLSKISLLEIKESAIETANGIVNYFLAQKIKLQSNTDLIINIIGRKPEYTLELFNILSKELKIYDIATIVCATKDQLAILKEFCSYQINMTKVKIDDEENPYNDDAIKFVCTSFLGEKNDSYISVEDFE